MQTLKNKVSKNDLIFVSNHLSEWFVKLSHLLLLTLFVTNRFSCTVVEKPKKSVISRNLVNELISG